MFIWTLRNMKSGNIDGILICWVLVIISLYMIFTGHRYIVKRKKKHGYAMILLGLIAGLFIVWFKKFL
ncbi:MAG: hypothetical protein ABRQ38_24880 [Candidatus Eremiobacterota bacterium]